MAQEKKYTIQHLSGITISVPSAGSVWIFPWHIFSVQHLSVHFKASGLNHILVAFIIYKYKSKEINV